MTTSERRSSRAASVVSARVKLVSSAGIVDLGRPLLDHREAAGAAHGAAGDARPRIEAEQADQVAALQRDEGRQQRGGHRAVDLGHAVDRLAHQPAAVDGQHDVVVLLDAELARQQLAVAGAALPVDHPPAHAGLIVLERLELAALAGAPLRVAVGQRVALQERDRLVARAADVGQHRHLAVRRQHDLLPDQPERPAPAQPQPVEAGDAAPQRLESKIERSAAGVGNQRAAGAAERRQARCHGRRAPRSRAAAGRRSGRRHGRRTAADADLRRRLQAGGQRCPSRSGGGVDRQEGKQHADPQQSEIPMRRQRQRDQEGRHGAGRRRPHRAAARIDQRGASVASTRSETICSTRRPSICAAGDRMTRWRSAGTASALTSSGMT